MHIYWFENGLRKTNQSSLKNNFGSDNGRKFTTISVHHRCNFEDITTSGFDLSCAIYLSLANISSTHYTSVQMWPEMYLFEYDVYVPHVRSYRFVLF